MSIALVKVLQRVVVSPPRAQESTILPGGRQTSFELPQRVHAVLAVIFDQVLDDEPYAPVRLFVEEIARRSKKKLRSTQLALRDALLLGLIKRQRVDAGWGKKAVPWMLWAHGDLIEASTSKTPWAGAPMAFHRPWLSETGQLQPDVTKDAGASSAGKKEKKRTSPPRPPARPAGSGQAAAQRGPLLARTPGAQALPSSQTPLALSPALPTKGGLGGGGARNCKKPRLSVAPKREGMTMQNFESGDDEVDAMSGPAARAATVAALASWRAVGAARFAAAVAAPPAPGDAQVFWDWFIAGARAAGWREKNVGDWPGAVAGDVEFSMQRRSVKTGERGAPLARKLVPISGAAAGAAATLGSAQRWTRGPYEAVFHCKGVNPLLIIDDAKPAHLHVLDGWDGVAVLETSPGNLQLSLMAPRCLQPGELLVANRALADMFGLKREAVAAAQLRRFPGSRNNKHGLAGSFVTRLFCPPRDGTISDEQLALLLHSAPPVVALDALRERVNAKPSARVTAPIAPTALAVHEPRVERAAGDVDHSVADWRFVMQELGKPGGMREAQLIDELTVRCVARARKGKSADDPEHCAYSIRTVTRALQKLAERRAAAAVPAMRKVG